MKVAPFGIFQGKSAYKKTVVLANKSDLEGAGEHLEALKDLYTEKFPLISISSKFDGQQVDQIHPLEDGDTLSPL